MWGGGYGTPLAVTQEDFLVYIALLSYFIKVYNKIIILKF